MRDMILIHDVVVLDLTGIAYHFFYDDCFLNKFLSTGKHSAMSSSEMRLFMAPDFYARWVVALTDFHYIFFFCVCLSPVYWQNLLGPSTVWRLGLF